MFNRCQTLFCLVSVNLFIVSGIPAYIRFDFPELLSVFLDRSSGSLGIFDLQRSFCMFCRSMCC